MLAYAGTVCDTVRALRRDPNPPAQHGALFTSGWVLRRSFSVAPGFLFSGVAAAEVWEVLAFALALLKTLGGSSYQGVFVLARSRH